MKLYVEKGWVYTDLVKGYILCIGKVDEVNGQTPLRLAQMAMEAFATAAYHNITSSKGIVLH
jgi:hypothetical protein